jgi:sigma-E processing peptidase SpoIIGA
VFFFSNALMNACIFMLAGIMIHTGKKHKMLRIAAAALFGSGMELSFVLLLRERMLFLLASYFAAIPLMQVIAFGKCRMRMFVKNTILCFAAALLLGGAVTAIENTWGIQRMPLLAGTVAMLVCIPLFRSMIYEGKKNKNFCAVRLEHRGNVVSADGLLDTGNLLTDPAKNMPVNIVSPELLQQLAVRDEDRSGVVLYQSLGKNCGVLETYCIDRLSVRTDGSWQQIAPAMVAAAPGELFFGKNYEVILNAQIMLHGF